VIAWVGGVLALALLAVPPVQAKAPGGLDGLDQRAVRLTPCKVLPHGRCGSIERLWEPGNPAAGTITVGFAFVPARDRSRPALGTVVPHEGGPGYSTTGTAASYATMYGPLLDRRNLLLVDQRGTGRSEPISCPALQHPTPQDLEDGYAAAAAACGAALGARADDYSTALSADDLAAVVDALGIGPVDVYGDSYGTFFAQVYAGRHPEQVRSVVLDSAYPAYGEDAWYATQGPAMRRSFAVACRRALACRDAGRPFLPTLDRVLAAVREKPWRGTAHDADGRRVRVTVDGPGLVAVAFGATYTPAFYRELTAALRSGLSGDRRPLLRLVAEATGGDTDAGPVKAYSEGLAAAVTCHDYPQLYDMTAPPAVRQQQYSAALDARALSDPETYGPFTIREYADSDWQALDWCTQWPSAPASNPAGPPVPPSGHYPDVPVLVLSGELDSITTPAEGDLVVAQFPNARHVTVANSFHVTAIGDTDACAVRIVRSFVSSPSASIPRRLQRCARTVAPVRALDRFPRALPAHPPAAAIARAAALTVADLPDRWWNNYSGHGVGLRGGTWSYTGDRVVRFRLSGVRLLPGLPVSGTAVWDRYGATMTVSLAVAGGRLEGSWDTRTTGARVALTGHLRGHSHRWAFLAP
jgi:pimeloyl-ACP methyl ester carboxylesterase